jgi:hypothetical protein
MLAQIFPVVVRYLAMVSFAFWQGGFVFYAGVVVPLGTAMWGDRTQGFLTRQVTPWMNVAGLVACGVFLLDSLLWRRFRRLRLGLALVLGAGVLYLIWLHPHLNTLMVPETETILDRRAFRMLHKIYLWLCTVLWMVSLVWLGLSIPVAEKQCPEAKENSVGSERKRDQENAKGPQKLGNPNTSAAQEA